MSIIYKGTTVANAGGTYGGSSGAENVYSTEETVIGTWIDGKPIYRKVIEAAAINGSQIALVKDGKPFVIPGIDVLVNSNARYVRNKVQINKGIDIWSSSAIYGLWNVGVGEGGVVYIWADGLTVGSTIHVILEYTKTID